MQKKPENISIVTVIFNLSDEGIQKQSEEEKSGLIAERQKKADEQFRGMII